MKEINYKKKTASGGIIVETYPEVDYILVYRPRTTMDRWVAAWHYDYETGCWGQGHYFSRCEFAIAHIMEIRRKAGIR